MKAGRVYKKKWGSNLAASNTSEGYLMIISLDRTLSCRREAKEVLSGGLLLEISKEDQDLQ